MGMSKRSRRAKHAAQTKWAMRNNSQTEEVTIGVPTPQPATSTALFQSPTKTPRKRHLEEISPLKIKLYKSPPSQYKCYGKRPSLNLPNSTIEKEYNYNVNTPTGRRLFTIESIDLLMSESAKHGRSCAFPLLKISKEHRDGLKTTLTATCRTCKKYFTFSNDEGENNLAVNEAAIWAGNTTGAGFTIMKHAMTALDIPFLVSNTYSKLETKFSKKLHEIFLQQLKQNGEEEKRMAVELKKVGSDGIPYTDIIVDGQWSQRCYNSKGRANTGSAVGLGVLTGKPLFVGVRNKVCYICQTQPDKEHECFKNWDGTSSGMETDIIMEGFKNSIKTHGLRYRRLVGDGDSSVYQAIKDTYMKENYFTSVQKIQCYLHAIRSMNRNLLQAIKSSNPNTGYKKYERDCLEDRVYLFGKYVNYLIALHIQHRPNGTNADTLADDLIAMPYHIFDCHKDCSSIMCNDGTIVIPDFYKHRGPTTEPGFTSSATHRKFREIPSDFFSSKIWKEITAIIKRLAELSISLIYRMNTNLAESFQSQINKFAQGRRTNIILRGGYNRRVEAATLSFMYGPSWYVDLYEKMNPGKTPSELWKGVREQLHKLDAARKARPLQKRSREYNVGKSDKPEFFSKPNPEGDRHYGDRAQREDKNEETVQFEIQKWLTERSVTTKEEQWEVHTKTIGQFENDVYIERRNGLITASIAGSVCGLKNSTSNVGMIDAILRPLNLSGTPPIAWGHLNEKKARELYMRQTGASVTDAGLFISMEFAGFGASPDALIGDDGILEIKCPYIERNKLPENVAARKKGKFIVRNKDGEYSIVKTHHYYKQIVMQLHITGRVYCDFVVWTQGAVEIDPLTHEARPILPEGHILVIRVWKSEETQKTWEKMRSKMTTFFMEDLVWEIIDPRFDRNMGYRQPAYRLAAIKAAAAKKAAKAGASATPAVDPPDEDGLLDV